jgi:hypothetical protein
MSEQEKSSEQQKAQTKTVKSKSGSASSSKKTPPARGASGASKANGASTTNTTPSRKSITPQSAVSQAKDTTRKVTEKAKQVAEQTAVGAAKVGKAAHEFTEGIQKKVEKDIAPAAERAKRSLSETTKKVREELGPAAEKAGKGLSAAFKATARATRKSARILGIKASISADMRKRQKLFAQLGETYFRVQKKKTPAKSDQDALNSLVADIAKLNAEIKTLEVKEKATRESP